MIYGVGETLVGGVAIFDSSGALAAPTSIDGLLFTGTSATASVVTVTYTQAVESDGTTPIVGVYVITASLAGRSVGDNPRVLTKATVGGVTQRLWGTMSRIAFPAALTGGIPIIGTGANQFKSDASANVTLAATQGDYAPAKAGDAMTVESGTGVGQLDVTGGVVKANTVKWLDNDVTSVVDGIPAVDVEFVGSDSVSTNHASGLLPIDLRAINGIAAYTHLLTQTRKIWFVRKTGNDSTGIGSVSAPYLTIGKAVSVAESGDTINVGDGTYTEYADGTGLELHIVGTGPEKCVMTYTAGATLLLDSMSSVRGMTLSATGTGSSRGQNHGLRFISGSFGGKSEDCVITGGNDGIGCNSTHGVQIVRCDIAGTFDGADFTCATYFTIDRCRISSDCTWQSGANPGCAIRGGESGVIADTELSVSRNDTTDQDTGGIYTQGRDVVLRNTTINVSVLNAANTGTAFGIADDEPGLPGSTPTKRTTLDGVSVTVAHANASADAFQLINSDGVVVDVGSNIEASRVSGNQPTGTATIAATAVTQTTAGAMRTAMGLDTANLTEMIGDVQTAVDGGLTSDDVAAVIAQRSNIQVNSPISGDAMTIVHGDGYSDSQGTAISLAKQSGETGWPDTISTIHFSCFPDDKLQTETDDPAGIDDVALINVTNSGGDLELTSAQTATLSETLKAGRYRFVFIANQDTAPKTLRKGTLAVEFGDEN